MPYRPSLRALLIAPYLALIVLLALVLGTLSYRTGRDAVDTWSEQLLIETVNRISQAVERHIDGSEAVLEAAFPTGVPAPVSIEDDLQALRTRFWLATSVHRDPNNYAYYGDVDGQFFGLWRYSAQDAELRLRTRGGGPRRVHPFSGINGVLGEPTVEKRIFDPRERPWFKAGQAHTTSAWTSIYIDFKTSGLVATRARRVLTATGDFRGVVATDLSLERVNGFLQSLALSRNGVAMVVEADGSLIGLSRGPHLRGDDSGVKQRLNAADSDDPLVVATFQAVRRLMSPVDGGGARTGEFTAPDGATVQAAYAHLTDSAGLDWMLIVAVPRHDFMARVEQNFKATLLTAALASLVAVAIGLWILATVSGELRRVARAARRIGDGDWTMLPASTRRDELGDLARSFTEMQTRLLTDPLTGLANRDAVLRNIEERIVQQRRRADPRPFAVLFIDLNRFKQINDRFGHDVGDSVLREMAHRLRGAVRARDVVARYAGDEFVVVLDSLEHARDADNVREKLEQALLERLDALRGELASFGAAIGVAIYPTDGLDVDTLIHHADADMYRRKAARP